jgi:type III pantothenate kinase
VTTPSAVCPGDAVLVADVGNSRIKLAVVEDHGVDASGVRRSLPKLSRRQDLSSRSFRAANLVEWLRSAAPGRATMMVASVHDAAAARLEATVAEVSATQHRPIRQRRIGHAELPLAIDLPEPHRVGVDRLAAATAAAFLKRQGRAAIVVDCGTAATVNLISADGVFLGGAILPGPALMARALADGTSRLPELDAVDGAALPAMPGRSTADAITAGIGLGFRGAIVRLVDAARAALGPEAGRDADCILTGGFAACLASELPAAIHVPDLVLAGIAMAAARVCSTLSSP